MGMYDSIYRQLECPVCGLKDTQEIQTKAFDCCLMRYAIGDVIPEAPKGDVWLEEAWMCEKCYQLKKDKGTITLHPVFVHVVDGLIVEIAYTRPEEGSADNEMLMSALYEAARKATERKFVLSSLYHLIQYTRSEWRVGADDYCFLPWVHLHLPENETQLLDRIVGILSEQIQPHDKEEL